MRSKMPGQMMKRFFTMDNSDGRYKPARIKGIAQLPVCEFGLQNARRHDVTTDPESRFL
jgi:hypothetical protein